MPWTRVVTSVVLASMLVGCPSNATEPEGDSGSALTGRFEGSFLAVDDSVVLDGYLTLDLTESAAGSLSGTFALEGMLDDGEFQQPIAGAGPLTGSVSPTSIGLLHFTATPDFCPQHPVEFNGNYDRRSGGLLVGGEIDILDGVCAVVFTFPSTIPMRR
jgi:hypothetical protein